ncbi:MAG: hypothetical protein JNL28_13570 [Planctomycetes bacterium]|nr:hypothetical protein [Planctomycetota bacterium]
MSSALRHALISIAIVVLAMLSHGGLLRAGLLGDDQELLRQASQPRTDTTGASAGWLEGGKVRPVPTLLLRVHDVAFEGTSLVAPRRTEALRMTAFFVLLSAALAAGFALRRALVPWSGADNARAAGFACALFLATHPLSTSALARPRALADLSALLLGALAAALFLRGRQAREKHSIVGAGCAAIAAGFASSSALLLPFVLCGMELGSARRPRTMPDRLRTAATTFLIFTACVLVEGVVATAAGLPARAGFAHSLPDLSVWSDPSRAVMSCVEKLGLLFFPITGGSLAENWPDYLVCLAVPLLALWPVLRSARVAPRLWGYLAVAWIVAMLLAVIPLVAVRVAPDDGTYADLLVVAGAFAAAGLAVAATSLLGTRRILLPGAIAILFSWLGTRTAHHYSEAAHTVATLRSSIDAAQASVPIDGQVLVVDPPIHANGLALGTDPLQRILVRPASRANEPRTIVAGSIPMLSRTDFFTAWRARGVAFLERARSGDSVPTSVRVIAPTEGAPPPGPWQGPSRSELFDLDPESVRFARVQALPQTSLADAPRIAWRASEPSGEWVVATGVWLAGEINATAIFDLWSDPNWWSVPTVRRVRAEDPLVNVALFELLPDLPLALAGDAPRVEGTDWRFELPRDSLAPLVRGNARFVLELLDTVGLYYARFECEETISGSLCVLRAFGAEGFVSRARARSGGQVLWSLERRAGDSALARSTGKR